MTVPDPKAQDLDLLFFGGGGRPVNFWCLKAGGFLKQELSMERWILRWIFLVAKYKGKIRQKNPPEYPPAGIEKSAGGEPPVWDLLRLSVSVAGLCKAPLFVEVHILLHNQSLEGCIRFSGQVLNEEGLAMASQRCMHCQFLVLKFGP